LTSPQSGGKPALSELLADTNRFIEQEAAQQALLQKRELAADSGKRGVTQLDANNSPTNRLAAGRKPSFADYRHVGESDGISTVVRQDSQARFAGGVPEVLKDIPAAGNRIFLAPNRGTSSCIEYWLIVSVLQWWHVAVVVLQSKCSKCN
jgi:hypothetical protein